MEYEQGQSKKRGDNMVYPFLCNMWIMKRLDEQYLTQMVLLKRITEEEKEMILATPQM